MLFAAVVILRPVEPVSVPAWLARAVHAWLLARIAQADPALAECLYQGEGPHPFTVSNLWGTGPASGGRVTLDPQRPCELRLTGLTEEVSRAIERALPGVGEVISLAGASLRVIGVATEAGQHPWAGRATYTDLLQQHALRLGPTPRGVTLRFVSPTAFRHQGRDLPLPFPFLVVDSLLHKWNAFSPVALPAEARRYAEECVALGRFRLRSHLVSFEEGDKGTQVGVTGEVRFRFLNSDPYWNRVMITLAAYAFWAGVGSHTTMGMGQTQLIGPPSSAGEGL